MKIENASNTVSDKSPVHGPRYRNLTLGSTSLAVEVNTNLICGKGGCEEAKGSKDLGNRVLHVRNGIKNIHLCIQLR